MTNSCSRWTERSSRFAYMCAQLSAKSDAERKAAEAKVPKEADFLPRVHNLIANGASDDIAAEALAFAIFGLDTKDQKGVVLMVLRHE